MTRFVFVDLMADIYTTFAERFLRAQISFGPPAGGPPPAAQQARPAAPKRRYNALGVLEDVPADDGDATVEAEGAEPVAHAPVQREAMVVGAGRPRALNRSAEPAGGGSQPSGGGAVDWSTVGRNDPCPCGSGKKFKKCHGATA